MTLPKGNTLFLRISLLMTGGIIVILSIGIIAWVLLVKSSEQKDRERFIVEAASQVLSIYYLLNGTPQESRQTIINELSMGMNMDPFMRIELKSEEIEMSGFAADPVIQAVDRFLNRQQSSHIAKRLNITFEHQLEMSVYDSEVGGEKSEKVLSYENFDVKSNLESEAASVNDIFQISRHIDEFNPEDNAINEKVLQLQLQFDDKSWVTFYVFGLYWTLSLTDVVTFEVLGFIVLLLVSLLILGLILTKWITKPLVHLAETADALGWDITKKQQLEIKGPREILSIANALKIMQQRILGQLDEKTRIFAAMSHDLKTPITRLRLRVDLLKNSEIRNKFSGDLDQLQAIVTKALDFAKSNHVNEKERLIDIDSLVSSIVDDLQVLGKSVSISGRAEKPYLGQPDQLRRCISNLVENAVFYGNKATIEIQDSNNMLMISIKDNGPGIHPTELEKVFEPYYRVEQSRNLNTGGSGLGISIANQIARAHRGSIQLKNREDQMGLEVILSLKR